MEQQGIVSRSQALVRQGQGQEQVRRSQDELFDPFATDKKQLRGHPPFKSTFFDGRIGDSR